MYPRPTRGPAASIRTLAPGTGSPCVLTTRPTRSGPEGENAGVLGGKAESGARAKAGGLDACAVLEPRVCCVRPRSTPPSTTAASKQTGTSQPRRGLASSLMGQSVSNITIVEKGIPFSNSATSGAVEGFKRGMAPSHTGLWALVGGRTQSGGRPWCERPLPPHPGPLPWGEGESHPVLQ